MHSPNMRPTIVARSFVAATCLATLCAALPSVAAAKPADQILTADAVAFFSVADPEDLQARWERTQVGIFTKDPVLQPFVKQMKGNLVERFGNIEQRLGMTLADVTSAAGGEVAVAMLHDERPLPDGSKRRASIAVLIDTTGKDAEADQLVAKTEAQLAQRGATRRSESYGGAELTILTLPATAKRKVVREIVQFRSAAQLVAVDSVDQAKRMVDTLAGRDTVTLSKVREYRETMDRCSTEAKTLTPNVRWFAAPFKWDAARRTLHDNPALADRKDTLTILGEQGFDAVRGVGGFINLAVTPAQDFVHRTAIYAPPKPGTEGKSAKEKYDLGMRMAELPNRADMPIEPWAPRQTATYTTVNLDILNAFDHVASVFDAMSGFEGAFRHTLDSFEVDPYGPEIKVREELVMQLGKRITMMTDYTLPIAPDCERYLFVVEVKNPDLLRSPIDKLMENDGAVRREANGIAYWEIVPEGETLTGADLDDGLMSIEPIDDAPSDAPAEKRIIRRAAVCLNGEHLIVASDVEFLRKVLFGIDPQESLSQSPDYQEAMRHIGLLSSDERCSWSFFRTDESIRPSYELIRQGLMPQAQTFFGRFLNELLTTKEDEEKGVIRKQRIDGSRLPSFELARRYFGPSARSIRTDDDGWFITGVVLSKAGQ